MNVEVVKNVLPEVSRLERDNEALRARAEWWATMARKLMAERDGDDVTAQQLRAELVRLTPAH